MILLNNMRYGFSMIMAIFVILLLSSIGAFIVNLSGKTVKDTTFQYRKEQSAFLAKSYTELAIMGVTANDATSGSNCLEEITGTVGGDPTEGEGYEVQVDISYIGDNSKLKCTTVNILSKTYDNLGDEQLYIVVDVFIRYIDFDIVSMATVTDATPRITYHRRTIQRI